jgi:hypothetical protein
MSNEARRLEELIAAERAVGRPDGDAVERIWPRVQARVRGELPPPPFTRGGLRVVPAVVVAVVLALGAGAVGYAFGVGSEDAPSVITVATPPEEVPAPAAATRSHAEERRDAADAPSTPSNDAVGRDAVDAARATSRRDGNPTTGRRAAAKRPAAKAKHTGARAEDTPSELELVRNARAALARGQHRDALDWIARWREHSGRMLDEEARAIEAAGLCASGRTHAGLEAAAALRSAHPHSAHERLVQKHCPAQ